MLGRFFDKILHEDEETIEKVGEIEKEIEEVVVSVWKKHLDIIVALVIFALSLGLRLYFLYRVSDPQNPGDGWAGDAFHHWQIAYLTREIGLGESFMRLWDLKGMEYFWGPLHPLLMILMFKISGTVSIVNARVLSTIFGSLVIALLYLIINKFWNRQVALATVFLALVNPVGILDDTFGLLEPIGLSLLLFGLLILEKHPISAGFLWALAAMARAEAWIFAGLLLILSPRILKKSGQLPKLFLGWGITMVIYMKYLINQTNNPIYPLWWNYLANARGVWATEKIYTYYQLSVKPYLVAWFGVSSILMLLIWLRNKGKSSVFLIFGFFYWAFIGGMMGLSHYLTGFQPWFWFIRFFQFPYYFAGFIIALFFFYLIPKAIPIFKKNHVVWIFWIPIVIIAANLQFIFWKPIIEKYNSTKPLWEQTKATAKAFVKEYEGGKVLIPEGDPNITYAMVYFEGIEGKNIIGQMFDPYFYMEDEPYDNWGENREIVLDWIKKEDIRLIMVYDVTYRYLMLFEEEPEYFEQIKNIPSTRLFVYRAYPEKIELQ